MKENELFFFPAINMRLYWSKEDLDRMKKLGIKNAEGVDTEVRSDCSEDEAGENQPSDD